MTTPGTIKRPIVAYRILDEAKSIAERKPVWVYVDVSDYVEGKVKGIVEALTNK